MRVMIDTRGVTTFVASSRPPSPTSNHREIHALPCKRLKRQRGHAFKIRRMCAQFPFRQQLLNHRMNPRKNLCKPLVSNLFSGNANALVDSLQMRRSVQSCAKTRLSQNLFKNAAVEPFPFVPAIWNARIRAIRPPQRSSKMVDVFEIEFGRGRLRGRRQFAA